MAKHFWSGGTNKMKKILAIIPARGGSKGIKNKNIIGVNKLPLIAYTIKPALKIKREGLITDVIVSTDSTKIATVSKKFGANVPFLRPANIAGDRAKSIDVILHAIDFFAKKGKSYDYVVLLQPTSPLRLAKDIKEAINFCLKNKGQSLISAYKTEGIIESIIYTQDNIFAKAVLASHNQGVRRQEAKEIFVRNGAIYITAVDYIKRHKKIISDKPLLFAMPKSRSLNIDSKDDLIKLRKILCK